jgi:hypothetical protein
MLITMNWAQEPVPVYYRFGLAGFEEGSGSCEARCNFVRIRCGEESRVAVGLALRLNYDLPDSGVLRIEASDVPDALRAGLLAVARGDARALPDAVFVGTWRDYAGFDLGGLEVLAATCDLAGGPAAFTVGPVKRSDVETFLRHQAEEAREQLAGSAWAASG